MPCHHNKVLGEGRFEEVKTFVGWYLNSRRLTVSLTNKKSECNG